MKGGEVTGEHQMQETRAAAGHTGQSPGHGHGGEAQKVDLSTSHEYRNAACI